MFALSLALVVAAAPLSRGDLDAAASTFAAAHPGAALVRAAAGGLEHASGLAAPRLATGDEENARAFLAAEGRAFGVTGALDLRTVRVLGAPGAGGSAVFQRMVDGLPVFGGQVAVGWRADGAITVVNGARVLAAEPRGAFRVAGEAALATALERAPGVPGEASVEQGWLQYEGALYPAFRIEHGAVHPLDSFVSYVDAESGELLYQVSRVRTALHPAPPAQPRRASARSATARSRRPRRTRTATPPRRSRCRASSTRRPATSTARGRPSSTASAPTPPTT